MAQLSVKKLRKQLNRKGFEQKSGKQDHITYFLHINGRKTSVFVFWSHGDRELSEGIQGYIRREMHLTKKQFDSFVDCSLGKNQYAEIIESKGLA